MKNKLEKIKNQQLNQMLKKLLINTNLLYKQNNCMKVNI